MGESAVVLEFGDTISEEVHLKVRAFSDYLETHPFEGMKEYVPAFTTVTVYFDPWIMSEEGKDDLYVKVTTLLQGIIEEVTVGEGKPPRLVHVPVCYGDVYGPDLQFVATHNKITPEEVIRIHSGVEYRVYMIGFAPGFPYLGGMDARIAAPRKENPRTVTPRGSVGIAGLQTGIYSIETPGGWQLIGRTPISLFDPGKESPVLLKAGDLVKFVPISSDEYKRREEENNGA